MGGLVYWFETMTICDVIYHCQSLQTVFPQPIRKRRHPPPTSTPGSPYTMVCTDTENSGLPFGFTSARSTLS